MVSGGDNIVMLPKEALAFLLFMFANLVLATAYLLNSLLEAFRLLFLVDEKSSCEGGSG